MRFAVITQPEGQSHPFVQFATSRADALGMMEEEADKAVTRHNAVSPHAAHWVWNLGGGAPSIRVTRPNRLAFIIQLGWVQDA